MNKYILNENKEPVICNDLIAWAEWMKDEVRRVAHTEISDTIRVSTVFLGLDHSFGQGAPLLFETMIFGGEHDQYQERCSTWIEAKKQHEIAVNIAKGNYNE